MARAYARIGKLETELGNAAFARASSAYLGNTISLITRDDDTEWLGPRSEEFSFTWNGARRGLLDAGYVEWFDDVGPLGPALVQRRMGADVMLTIEDVALERHAALLRRVRVHNLARTPVLVERAAPLEWALRGRTEALAEAPGALVCRSAAERGLFLAGAGLAPEAESGALDVGRLVCGGARTLAPGEVWGLPVLWIAPFSGPIAEAWLRTQGTMDEAARGWESWDAEREALRRTQDEEDT